MSAGSVFKKCGCRAPVLNVDGSPTLDAAGKPRKKRIGSTCPKLRRGAGWNPTHGLWHFQLEFRMPTAGRQVVAHGGLATRQEAEEQLAAVRNLLAIADRLPDDADAVEKVKLDIVARIRRDLADTHRLPDYDAVRRAIAAGQPLADRMTVGRWLTQWLAARTNLAASSRRVYMGHVEQYLIPHLGPIPLDALRVHHLNRMFDAIALQSAQAESDNAARRAAEQAAKAAWRRKEWEAAREARQQLATLPPYRPVCGEATRARIRATLRSALSAACAQQLIVVNVAALIEMPAGRPPRARVWTDERVARWRETGELPSPVMVWTPAQTAVFLERAERHRLCALFQLVAFTGLRRGEVVGVRWVDIDLPARRLTVAQQVIQLGWETAVTAPKSESSERDVPLAGPLQAALAAHRQRQEADKAVAGKAWVDSGLVFTHLDGTELHPAWVSDQFHALAREAGLPPIRLHDLRHGAASLALAAGVDIKVVSELLGHSGTAITRDIYTSVFTPLKRQAVDAVAAALAAARSAPAEQPDIDEQDAA